MLSVTIFTIFLTFIHIITPVISRAIPNPGPLSVSRRDGTEGTPFPFDPSHAPVLEDVFDKIASIPDEVVEQGEAATSEWLRANTNLVARSAPLETRQGWIAIAKCAFEIAKAIIENGLPFAKIARLRDLIKILGGGKEVAKMLLKAKSLKELLIIGGPELAEIGEMLLGLQGVVTACFSWV